MKTLEEVKTEVANNEGWPSWDALAAPWVPSKDLEKHWEEVAKRYATEAIKSDRERVAETARIWQGRALIEKILNLPIELK